MAEGAYRRLVGPINPKKPNESLRVQLKMLTFVGLWAPETDNPTTLQLYNIYSLFYRGVFLYMYSLCQALFFMNVENVKDVADALFLLMTQISLLYKVEKFYSNRHRIRAIVKRLNSDLFCPMNDEEDQSIQVAMVESVLYCLGFLVPAAMTIAIWAVTPFVSGDELMLPIKAWYPFDTKPMKVYVPMFIFQIYGIAQSATFNISTDTISAALFGHAKAQIERLGLMLSKIGYEMDDPIDNKRNPIIPKEGIIVREYFDKNNSLVKDISNFDSEMAAIETKIKEVSRKFGKDYGDVVKCITFHGKILEFVAELQDIFRGPIFCQVVFSTLIICMTMLLIVTQTEPAEIFGSLLYLITMVAQVAIFCWVGNEIIYASNFLCMRAFFSNFANLDKPCAHALLFFMKRSVKEMHVKAGSIFQVTLSIPTLMTIIKSSYSYFAVLKSMQEK